MSTSSPTATLAPGSSSTPTPTTTSSQSDTATATLYLFTFLATVLVLVLLSASLVFRSYILRRRYRQGFREAFAGGLFPNFDPRTFNGAGEYGNLGVFRRSARRIGPKPVLCDTWIRPAEKGDAWSSITPVALRCTPLLSPLAFSLSPQPSPTSPGSPRPHQLPPWSAFYTHIRRPSHVSPSAPSSSLPPRQPHTPIRSPTVVSARSPSVTPGPPELSAAEQDAATLAVCVLVAMPDVSTPVYHLMSGAKGKGVDPLESQTRQESGATGSLLPSSPHRPDPRIPGHGGDEDGLPLIEFGIFEKNTGDWVWEHDYKA